MIHLTLHFSIVKKGGLEVFSFNVGEIQEQLVDSQLLSGFMTAIQLYSESMGTSIKQIQFNDFTLYFNSYGDFSLRLMLLEKLNEEEFKEIFNKLSIELFSSISERTEDLLINENEIQKIVQRILSPYYQDTSLEQELLGKIEEGTISKITLVGLAKAGKTSIKNMFFDQWSREMVKNIQPTVRFDIALKFLDFINHKIAIHDFGGQVTYREEYKHQEEIWRGISTFIFVVDIQDPHSFHTAAEYLSEIYEIIKRNNEFLPQLSIFLHKYDINQRKELKTNIKDSLIHFREFTDIATFYLTTIDDSSSNIALLKSLYFSLPEIMLKRLLEEEFLDYFDSQILPKYIGLAGGGDFNEIFQSLKPDLIKNATIYGLSIGYLLQKSWMDALMGKWIPKHRLLTSKSLTVKKERNSLYITIPNWSDEDIPMELTNTLLESMFIGVLKTFDLPGPLRVEETEYATTWEVRF